MIIFPKGFFFGAAGSAYQVEGDNLNSDWWEWEKKAGLKDLSGQACRHYELYKSDFDLAKSLNHNCHRFSVEWSRIEPQEGKFSAVEIAHYRDVVLSLRERGLEPVVTLHHFTNPIWFSKLGGWQNKESAEYFLRYVKVVVEALCDKVRFWVTINEPKVYVYYSYILGLWPPQERSFLKADIVTDNLADGHIKAYNLIHSIYKSRNLSLPSVSIAKNFQVFEPCKPTLRNKFAAYLRDRSFNLTFLHKLIKNNALDYLGINYYTRSLVDTGSWRMKNLLLDSCKEDHSQLPKNSLGWEVYPEGLCKLLLRLKKYNLPIFILENGICTYDDSRRWEFIFRHLESVNQAMQGGAKVIGYIYWSLLDNFEWDKGFNPRFGLVRVDYHTQERSIRHSARNFSEVCRTGALEI